MSRREFFYAQPSQIAGDQIHLLGDEHEHCARVLRKAAGDSLTIVDGEGHAFDGVITTIEKSQTRVRVTGRREKVGEPRTWLTLAQAIPKGSRFDWLVEKATELGVSAFIPLRCERSETVASAAKRERWQRLALAAMKQSCRSVLPMVEPERSFAELVRAKAAYDFALLAHETDDSPLNILQAHRARAARGLVMIGPEGGFSDAELSLAREANLTFFSLGPRRLRAETAGLMAAMRVFTALEEF
jgi:16S rRNA (uracil1498-N3)-methyltransferase